MDAGVLGMGRVRVWKDPWVTTLKDYKVNTPATTDFDEDMMVKDLIDQNTRQ